MLAENDSSVHWNSEDEEWADPRYEAWRELDGVEVMHGMQPNNVVFTKNELWRCKNQLAAAALYIEELESEIAEANLSAADTPKRAKGKRSGRAATKDDRRTGRAEHIGVCMPGTTFSTTKGHESASPESNIDSVDEPHALSLLGNHSMAADLMPHLDNNGHSLADEMLLHSHPSGSSSRQLTRNHNVATATSPQVKRQSIIDSREHERRIIDHCDEEVHGSREPQAGVPLHVELRVKRLEEANNALLVSTTWGLHRLRQIGQVGRLCSLLFFHCQLSLHTLVYMTNAPRTAWF